MFEGFDDGFATCADCHTEVENADGVVEDCKDLRAGVCRMDVAETDCLDRYDSD